MTEKRLFIKADTVYSDRWLHQSETFQKETNWNMNLPKEREFKTGECIVTDRDDTAYSIDELVNLLNYFNHCTVSDKEFMDLKEENKLLKNQLVECKNDEKQLSISFMDYKMQLIEVLQQNYNYAYNQRQKNLDKSIVARTYEVLCQTIYNIAESMNVDIEKFPKGDEEK